MPHSPIMPGQNICITISYKKTAANRNQLNAGSYHMIETVAAYVVLCHFEKNLIIRRNKMPDKMTIEFNNSKPVELICYTNSLLCLADEYRQFLLQDHGQPSADDSKLYIKGIKQGSIIADLISLSPGALPAIGDFNNILAFSNYLKCFFGALTSDSPDTGYNQKSLKNISGFIDPVAEDSKAQYKISTEINGDINLVININSTEANAIQNKTRKILENMKEPISGTYKNAVLYWFQTRNTLKSQAGYQGKIEEFSSNPVRVIMDSEIQKKIITSDENIYKLAYIVDVKVNTIDDKPVLYEILKLHDKIPKD